MAHQVYPHGGIEPLAEGLWLVKGGLPFPLRRNMAVFRLADGRLVLHSPVALDDAGLKALEGLGRVAFAIVPSRSHTMDASFYRQRYPGVAVVAPAAIREQVRVKAPTDASAEEMLPPLGFVLHAVPGLKSPEYVYEVPLAGGGRALIVNDAFANANAYDSSRLLGRLVVRRMGVPGDEPAVPRIVRWLSVSDLAALKRFAGTLAAIPDLRIITFSHGDPVTRDPAGALRAIAAG
ncbi:MAG TPA: hypothetical protein VFB16_04555 [Bauldia sp.]|nr:hypothetical protein [Bauldia sp.]